MKTLSTARGAPLLHHTKQFTLIREYQPQKRFTQGGLSHDC